MMEEERILRVYISGRISGNENYIRDFEDAEQYVSMMFRAKAVNPVRETPVGSYGEMIAADIRLLDKCDAIFMMKGWEYSQGARLEHDYAAAVGKEIIYQ